MNVLYIRNAYAEDFGGAEKLAVNLALEAKANGLASVLLTAQTKLYNYSNSNKIKTKKCPWLKNQNWSGLRSILIPFYLLWILYATLWYLYFILTNRIDVVHILSRDDFISATLAGKIARKKIYWTDCADLKHVLQLNKPLYKNLVGRLVFLSSRLADNIFLVSYSEQKEIVHSLGRKTPGNFMVLQLGARLSHYSNVKRNDKYHNKIIFISTSRLVKDKGIAELIKAFRIINISKKYILWLIGDGKDREYFEKLAHNNEQIIFYGFKDNPLDYLNQSDVYVLPTYHEGFSLSMTEAAMLGKPMIATKVGGNPEIINSEDGILVNPKDPIDLSKAMEKLAKNSNLRKKMGIAAKYDYESRLNFSKIYKNIILQKYYEK